MGPRQRLYYWQVKNVIQPKTDFCYSGDLIYELEDIRHLADDQSLINGSLITHLWHLVYTSNWWPVAALAITIWTYKSKMIIIIWLAYETHKCKTACLSASKFAFLSACTSACTGRSVIDLTSRCKPAHSWRVLASQDDNNTWMTKSSIRCDQIRSTSWLTCGYRNTMELLVSAKRCHFLQVYSKLIH